MLGAPASASMAIATIRTKQKRKQSRLLLFDLLGCFGIKAITFDLSCFISSFLHKLNAIDQQRTGRELAETHGRYMACYMVIGNPDVDVEWVTYNHSIRLILINILPKDLKRLRLNGIDLCELWEKISDAVEWWMHWIHIIKRHKTIENGPKASTRQFTVNCTPVQWSR